MKKVTLSLITVLMFSLLVTGSASATPPEEAFGTFSWISDDPDGTSTYGVDGTFVGLMTLHNQQGNRALVVCEPCAVDGKTGTVVLNLVYMNYKHERGNWNTLYGTGDLKGVHFRGKHERPLDEPDGIYYGKIHFDPQ